ncbi:hypothetical protein FQN52_009284 [Onygenales sp. PD_12]|nr:hypothetical protein FQN52_009284 [Onygenales sp. PD_12]
MTTLDPPTILTNLTSLISSLQNNPHIHLKHHSLGPPTPPQTLTTLSARLHLPPDIIAFYTATSHFTVEWEYKGPKLTLASVTNTRTPNSLKEKLKAYIKNFAPHGSINILPLEEVFSSWEDSLWFPTETDKVRGYTGWGRADGDGEGWMYRFRHVKSFDLFMPEASVGFLMEWEEGEEVGGWVGGMMAYHYHGEELEVTDMSFRGYLERLLVSRGFWAWHTLGEREVGVLAKVLFRMDGKGVYDPDSSSEWEP